MHQKKVEIPAHCDLWMQGAKTGTIVKTEGDVTVLRMDHPQVKRLVRIKTEELEQFGRALN